MPGSQEPVVAEPSIQPLKDDKTSAANGVGENGQAEKAGSGDEKVKSPSKEDYESGPGLLAQGKRHLYVKDYPSAASTLGDACAKLGSAYGELSDECADAYYYYGCALLELSREEMGVLGEPENKEQSDASNDEEESEEEAQEEGSKVDGKGEEETAKQKSEESKDGDEENAKESDDKEEGSEDTEKDNEACEEVEDVNNLQLAWEMFDLARVIYERQNADKKIADAFLKLGEVAMESENYDSAVDDMQKCLTIQQKIFSSDNRAIAETLFQLGVASSLCNQFDEAIKFFTNAGVVLEKRIRNLTSTSTPDPENLKKNPFYTIEKEVEELRALLPEIKDKIADMEDFKSEALKALKENLTNRPINKEESGAGPSSSAANGSSSSSADPGPFSASPSKGPANDISHLIRKKRKAGDAPDAEKDKTEAKKPNVEASS